MNVAVLKALFADRSAYQLIEAPARTKSFYADFGLAPMSAFAEAN